MTEPFSITDRRGLTRTGSNFYVGNADTEMRRLRQAGYTLPNSPVQARLEAKKVADTATRGSLADSTNKALAAQMRRSKMAGLRSGGGMSRTASNVQMAMPKIRQPFSSLEDKGIPYNVQDPKELTELRRWCNAPDAPVWMADYTFKAIGDIQPGDQVIGWDAQEYERTNGRKRKDGKPSIGKRRTLTKTTVLAVNRRMAPEVVRITFASGRVVKCTPDHEWLRYYPPGLDGRILNGPEQSRSKRYDSDYAPLNVGSVARSVIRPTQELSVAASKAASYLAGIIDGEGSWTKRTVRICQSEKHNPQVVQRIDESLEILGLTYSRRHVGRNDPARGSGHHGGDMVLWDICQPDGHRNPTDVVRGKNRQQIVDIFNWGRPAKFDTEHMDRALLSSNFGEPDTVVSIESLGPGEVVSMQTTTGNYTAWGYASKNCRMYYSTHDLVPLLIDIYSKFPVVGLEFRSTDKKIQDFYESMFMDDLNYGEFLSEGLGREYFTVGEVTSLAHFNESLGIWSSEEILNPDMVRVSKSLFVQEERVQLMVKELVENLRSGPQGGGGESEETPSERMERTWEYQQLIKQYPEIVKAAAQDDGLDISDALVSRLVNKAAFWDLRGTPHLLRSFRTLMMEESLNAAQDAVADRLYAPMILATMGIENMGDGEPWIPDQGELDDLRDDMQNALSADFKLMVHNFGVNVQSVFGRESVPRFDQDYDRIDAKLLQAWGIGQALIAGGSGAGGTYASSALNREVCEQLMLTFQKKVLRHMRKRAEVIAEAQEHYDYELKGGLRVPIYREIVQFNEETGEEEIVRVPKLLLPEIKFATLNLRDEAQERQFIAQLKEMGVPVSDGTLAVNIPIEFNQELEKQAEETVSKGLAKAQAMQKLQALCDAQGLPYPDDLVASLSATLQLRQGLAQTEMVEGQAEMQEQQIKQMSPAGQMGLLPGVAPPPPPPEEGGGQQKAAASGPHSAPPFASGPGGTEEDESVSGVAPELPRNRQRPAESDEQRGSMPKGGKVTKIRDRKLSKFEKGPSSYGKARTADAKKVERAIQRRASGVTVESLVNDPEAYALTNMGSYESQLRADWPEIQAGGAPESRKLLEELIEQYEEVTGVRPRW